MKQKREPILCFRNILRLNSLHIIWSILMILRRYWLQFKVKNPLSRKKLAVLYVHTIHQLSRLNKERELWLAMKENNVNLVPKTCTYVGWEIGQGRGKRDRGPAAPNKTKTVEEKATRSSSSHGWAEDHRGRLDPLTTTGRRPTQLRKKDDPGPNKIRTYVQRPNSLLSHFPAACCWLYKYALVA